MWMRSAKDAAARYLESIIDFALKNEEAGPWLRQFILDKAEQLR